MLSTGAEKGGRRGKYKEREAIVKGWRRELTSDERVCVRYPIFFLFLKVLNLETEEVIVFSVAYVSHSTIIHT